MSCPASCRCNCWAKANCSMCWQNCRWSSGVCRANIREAAPEAGTNFCHRPRAAAARWAATSAPWSCSGNCTMPSPAVQGRSKTTRVGLRRSNDHWRCTSSKDRPRCLRYSRSDEVSEATNAGMVAVVCRPDLISEALLPMVAFPELAGKRFGQSCPAGRFPRKRHFRKSQRIRSKLSKKV